LHPPLTQALATPFDSMYLNCPFVPSVLVEYVPADKDGEEFPCALL